MEGKGVAVRHPGVSLLIIAEVALIVLPLILFLPVKCFQRKLEPKVFWTLIF
jgi:hypothetical protein